MKTRIAGIEFSVLWLPNKIFKCYTLRRFIKKKKIKVIRKTVHEKLVNFLLVERRKIGQSRLEKRENACKGMLRVLHPKKNFISSCKDTRWTWLIYLRRRFDYTPLAQVRVHTRGKRMISACHVSHVHSLFFRVDSEKEDNDAFGCVYV